MPLSTKAATRVAASPQLSVEYADLWLNAITSRVANLTVLDSNAYKGQHGPKVLQSNASVCLQPKSKREDKEAENDLHVGGLRWPSQTLYFVPGWESTGRRLWDCIDTALVNDRCDQTHAFVRASSFPGSTVQACRKMASPSPNFNKPGK